MREEERDTEAALNTPELPPFLVVIGRLSFATEHLPPPLVNEITERQERDLLQGHTHQVIDVHLCKIVSVRASTYDDINILPDISYSCIVTCNYLFGKFSAQNIC